jgi:hypothetical protein
MGNHRLEDIAYSPKDISPPKKIMLFRKNRNLCKMKAFTNESLNNAAAQSRFQIIGMPLG